MPSNLEKLTKELGEAYQQFKDAEREKNRLRTEFFEAVQLEVGDQEHFSFFNSDDGLVYTRSVSSSVMLDNERLAKENPELYEAITYEHTERKLKEIDELTVDQQAALEEYLYEDRRQVKLLAPRQASDEELAERD